MRNICEQQMVHRLLAGDEEAGEWLVREHGERIYRLLRHLTGCPEDAEDLTQQTFVKAWEGLADFRGQASLATWLHRIAYHEYTHWLRARPQPAAPLEDALELPDPRAGPELDGVHLRWALTQLPAEQREAFLLHHVQELSLREMSAVLETPVSALKWRLFAARRRLRELLSEPEEYSDEVPAVEFR